ncbi:MAG: hypothetical protein HN509_11710 [Halobacteriovoraceae bacterium]|jgi:hypothetical protein|nr:hypothetical protein [Halobacteriovoraceae bacterium]MBT5094505.1 hypothetical protein [Halobacteriovoraceae bacterium]
MKNLTLLLAITFSLLISSCGNKKTDKDQKDQIDSLQALINNNNAQDILAQLPTACFGVKVEPLEDTLIIGCNFQAAYLVIDSELDLNKPPGEYPVVETSRLIDKAPICNASTELLSFDNEMQILSINPGTVNARFVEFTGQDFSELGLTCDGLDNSVVAALFNGKAFLPTDGGDVESGKFGLDCDSLNGLDADGDGSADDQGMTVLRIDQGDVIIEQRWYINKPNCPAPGSSDSQNFDIVDTYRAPFTLTNILSATSIDLSFTFISGVRTAVTPAGEAALELGKGYCGVSDWTQNVAVPFPTVGFQEDSCDNGVVNPQQGGDTLGEGWTVPITPIGFGIDHFSSPNFPNERLEVEIDLGEGSEFLEFVIEGQVLEE